MVIYADLIFLINTISDILLFSAYRYIINSKTSMLKIIAVSALGGMYSVFESVYDISCYFRPLVLAGMCMLIWGRINVIKNTVRILFAVICVEGITILLVSCIGADARIAAGAVTIFIPKPQMLAVIVFAYVIYTAAKIYLKRNSALKKAELVINGKRVFINVLYDSGNLLKYKNKTVMIVRYDVISDALGTDDYNSFFNHSEAFVRYRTIQGGGVIPVIEPERCLIDGSECEIAAAVIREGFNGKYQGIIGTL